MMPIPTFPPPARVVSRVSAASLSRRDALRWLGLAGGAALAGANLGRAEEKAPDAEAPAPTKPAPPSLAGSQAGYYRFKIGGLEALALQDGGLTPPSDLSPFGVDEPAGAVAAALEAAWLPKATVQLPFNVLLVRLGAELVLVDSGGGAEFGESAGRLPAALAAAGVGPERITAVLLTHAHMDHFGGLLEPGTKAPRFVNARVFLSRKEHDFWMQGSPELGGLAVPPEAARGFVDSARATLGALTGRLELVAGGDRILDGIELLDTPGHTPGHLAAILGTGDERLLHLGDVAAHHVISFAHPGWRFAYDADPALAVETRRKLFDRAEVEGLRLFGGHLPFPALGRVRKTGDAFAFVAEPFGFA